MGDGGWRHCAAQLSGRLRARGTRLGQQSLVHQWRRSRTILPKRSASLAARAAAKASTGRNQPGSRRSQAKGRQVPDVSALADPYTGVPIVLTESGQQFLEVGVGGTSLASPIFTAIWTLAEQAAGHSLGQAARVVAKFPNGAPLTTSVQPRSAPTLPAPSSMRTAARPIRPRRFSLGFCTTR